MSGPRGDGVYRSAYFTHAEADVLDRIAEANGTSKNMVLRCALRGLAGLPAPRLSIPEDAGEDIRGEHLPAPVSAH